MPLANKQAKKHTRSSSLKHRHTLMQIRAMSILRGLLLLVSGPQFLAFLSQAQSPFQVLLALALLLSLILAETALIILYSRF